MFTPCEEHVHDDADRENINAWRVALLLNQLWAHENKRANLVVLVDDILVLVLGTETEVRHFETRQVIGVRDENVIRLQVSVHDLVAMQVVDSLEDCFDNLGGLFV